MTRSRRLIFALIPLLLLTACFPGKELGGSGVVIFDDFLYLSSRQGKVYALDIKEQKIEWTFSPQEKLSIIYSTPAVSEELVYFASFLSPHYASKKDSIYALKRDSGAVHWQKEFAGPFLGNPLIIEDKLILPSAERLYALDARTGELLWQFKPEGKLWASPVEGEGIIYIGDMAGNFYALQAENGEKLWQFDSGGAIASAAEVSENMVFLGNFAGRLFALKAFSGELVWTFDAHYWFWSQPLFFEGKIFAPSMDKNLYALDARTGKLIRSYSLPEAVRASPIASSDTLIVVTVSGEILALAPDNGEVKWRLPLGERVIYDPVLEQGMLSVVGEENLYVLELATAKRVWQFSLRQNG